MGYFFLLEIIRKCIANEEQTNQRATNRGSDSYPSESCTERYCKNTKCRTCLPNQSIRDLR